LVEVLMLMAPTHLTFSSLDEFCIQGNNRLLVYEYMPLSS
jgi:hypothetical protein